MAKRNRPPKTSVTSLDRIEAALERADVERAERLRQLNEEAAKAPVRTVAPNVEEVVARVPPRDVRDVETKLENELRKMRRTQP